MKVVVKFKKLDPTAAAPHQSSDYAAGYDLTATSARWDDAKQCWIFGTGLAVEIPEGYAGFLFPKSSVRKYGMQLSNCVGVVDADYRGEIMLSYRPYSPSSGREYGVDDDVAQLIILPVPEVQYVESDELSETVRGTRGHGEMDGMTA